VVFFLRFWDTAHLFFFSPPITQFGSPGVVPRTLQNQSKKRTNLLLSIVQVGTDFHPPFLLEGLARFFFFWFPKGGHGFFGSGSISPWCGPVSQALTLDGFFSPPPPLLGPFPLLFFPFFLWGGVLDQGPTPQTPPPGGRFIPPPPVFGGGLFCSTHWGKTPQFPESFAWCGNLSLTTIFFSLGFYQNPPPKGGGNFSSPPQKKNPPPLLRARPPPGGFGPLPACLTQKKIFFFRGASRGLTLGGVLFPDF